MQLLENALAGALLGAGLVRLLYPNLDEATHAVVVPSLPAEEVP